MRTPSRRTSSRGWRLEEAAADGAVLVEARFGSETVLRPGFVELFREAERRVRGRYPSLRAEAVVTLLLWYDPERLERLVDACLKAAGEGIAGIDLLYKPYDTEAEWGVAYRAAERAADAGLGVTAHAGEFSKANVEAALKVPGLTRLGHAVHAAGDPRLLEFLAGSGVTVECCLSCNVVLGAVPLYEEHPIRRFAGYGIPVVLGSDDPVQVCTTIGREYAAASALGFSTEDLLGFTTNAARAAFTTPERRAGLLLRAAFVAGSSAGTTSRRGPMKERADGPDAGGALERVRAGFRKQGLMRLLGAEAVKAGENSARSSFPSATS